MSLRSAVVSQFARPRGWAGEVAGWIMARRSSNRARNLWTVDLLSLEPAHRVLELGSGPGVALAWVVERVTKGEVTALEHSTTMLSQAARRSPSAVASGRLRLLEGRAEELPVELGLFDRIYSVNVVQFWNSPSDVYRLLLERLVPGGVLATTYMPRHEGAKAEDAIAKAVEIGAWMELAGFDGVRVEQLDLRPIPAVCVLGERPRGD